jgi:hypothetical protein
MAEKHVLVSVVFLLLGNYCLIFNRISQVDFSEIFTMI